jgi:hypothetical protein
MVVVVGWEEVMGITLMAAAMGAEWGEWVWVWEVRASGSVIGVGRGI